MIFRYPVECPGCKDRLLFRVSVGADDEQPFFAVCGRCRTVIKGKQVIWYKPFPGARLELESAKLLERDDNEKYAQTISINPDLPARRAATGMEDEGGSSFLHNAELLGNLLLPAMGRMAQFRETVKEKGPGLRRLANFYLERDWPHFQKEGRRVFGKSWTELKDELAYHGGCAGAFIVTYQPLLIGDWFTKFTDEWDAFLESKPSEFPAQRAFARAVIANGRVQSLQRSVLERLDFIASHRSALLCAIPAELYKDGMEKAIAELRLPRDDFDALKGHYVDCYELAHQVLPVMAGTINVIERGSADAFDPAICDGLAKSGMNNFKKVPSLEAFAEKPNGPKRAFLKSLPEGTAMWNALLDRDLRNAVGHYSARHDLVTGMVLVDGAPHCSYLEFVVKTLRMTHVLLGMLHVLARCHTESKWENPATAKPKATKSAPKIRFKTRKPKK